jgi:hypothetical protein
VIITLSIFTDLQKEKANTMANIVKGTGTMALAAFDSGAALKSMSLDVPLGPTDIQIDISTAACATGKSIAVAQR